jgi:hypothetical protein
MLSGRGRLRLSRGKELTISGARKTRFMDWARCRFVRRASSTGLRRCMFRPVRLAKAGLLAPEMGMTDVSTVVGYLNYMQSAIWAGASTGPDVFLNYATEIGLAGTPDQLVDRISLLSMAREMDGTLRGEILSAVSSIAIPTGDQDAINAALANCVKVAIFLTIASPSFSAQF